MFTIIPGPKARKFLKKANKKIQERIIGRIRKIAKDPMPRGSIKVVGEENTYRIRVGDYRILYEIYYGEKIILIANIDKMPRVYK